MEALKSKSSLFVERWGRAEFFNVQLRRILFLMTGTCCLLSAALVYLAVKPAAIYYIPGVAEAGTGMPMQSPQSIAQSFVTAWLLDWCNFTPASVEGVYQRAQLYMSPILLSKTKARLAKNIADVRYNNVSSLFSLTEDPVVDFEKGRYRVRIEGQKAVFVGKEEIKVQRLVFHVSLRKVTPTKSNPYGFLVEVLNQEVL